MKAISNRILITLAPWIVSCATHTESAPESTWASQVPPPQISIPLPLVPPEPEFAQMCQLGTSCLTMDPRPFEPCLLSTRHCRDKATGTVVSGEESRDNPALQETSAFTE
jgi:hypothetical protein